jgi:hypothetical protein
VYADGSFPIVTKLKGEEWQTFTSYAKGGHVSLQTASYQQLLALAASASGERAIADLQEWLARRVATVEQDRSV